MRNIFFFLFLFMFTFAACSSHSVKHLNRQRWAGEVPRTLAMKYWTFKYTTFSGPKDLFQIEGTAYPQKEDIPGWGRWLRMLNLAVYLCDEQGNVLASQHQSVSGQSMPYDKGVPFSFCLNEKQLLHARPLFVTFGYRMEVIQNHHSRIDRLDSELIGNHNEVFFASQGSIIN